MPRARTRAHRVPDAQLLAEVALELRPRLLSAHRGKLSREDLEDAYSQATLELLLRAQRQPFQSTAHVRKALQQKFTSRICDRRRAFSGRSPTQHAEATALRLDHATVELSGGDDPLARVILNQELTDLIAALRTLSGDQRLVLASQLAGEPPRTLCERTGWSSEKVRKLAQRARQRLRTHGNPGGPHNTT